LKQATVFLLNFATVLARFLGNRHQTRSWAFRFSGGGKGASPWLLDNGYQELVITSEHTVSIDSLPPIHKDPFDRILVAQATVEGITLLTADALVAKYPGPVRQV
jgi:hypothetical protein